MRVTRASTGGLAVGVMSIGVGAALLLLATKPRPAPDGTSSGPPVLVPTVIEAPGSLIAPPSSRTAAAAPLAYAPRAASEAQRPATFEDRRAARPTRLRTLGPVPLPAEEASSAPPDVEEVTYPSGGHALRAWFALPEQRAGLAPVVVYLHRGLGLGATDWQHARAFRDAGFAVLLPTFRGEVGNPGAFELLHGELDDARAACHWAAAREGTDANRIHVFGHDLGGALAGLLALADNVPVRLTGSVGGLWSEFVFDEWVDLAPFDAHDPEERAIRSLATNLDVMRRPHVAYVGQQDDEVMEDVPLVTRRAHRTSAPLEVVVVQGDHATSVPHAVREFIARIR